MNWSKILKYIVKNWKYILPIITSSVEVVRGLFKRKKKDKNEKYLKELNTPHV
jgi:uncharacterized membrane protein